MARKAQTDSIADANAAPGGAAAVDRALSLLSVFGAGDGALSLAELAERTRLYKSTTLRLLASLKHARLIQLMADGRYALGPEVARLHGIYAASFSLEPVVIPVLRRLVRQTGESAAYHVRQGQARLCLYRVDTPNPVRDHVKAGDLLPLERGAGARILAAFSDQPMGVLTRKDSTLYKKIRAQGYFAAIGDRTSEVAGISAPVFHIDGRLAGALTLTVPTHRYDEQHIQPVVDAAQQLSKQID